MKRVLFQVDLTWALPPTLHLYKCKPLEYISSLIGDEGKGSLMAYLRSKMWALSIYVGNGQTGADQNSIFTLFNVHIVLTKEGFANLDEVIYSVFSYIKLLKTNGPSPDYFNELKSIHEIAFKFAQEDSAVENVEEIAENMHYYPSTDYLTGPELFFQYDEAVSCAIFFLY